jgi:hypothetical protein
MKCKQCNTGFEITAEDRRFYESVSPEFGGKKYLIPEPTLCPDCRQQRRLAFVNESRLYYRKCDLTGKQIIAIYNPDSPFKVYNQKDWNEQKTWNPMDYGRDFDSSRPFFSQFSDLLRDTPHPSLATNYELNQNSDFTNYTGSVKDCYLIFHADFNESCYYGYGVKKCEYCVDCVRVLECKHCYECVDCTRCYGLKFSRDCENCHDGYFLDDCIGCRNCLGCSGLRNKQYCINNKAYSKKDYEKFLAQFQLNRYSKVKQFKELAREYRLQSSKKFQHIINCQNSYGDYLIDCKNSFYCFDCSDLEDCAYCYQLSLGAKNCHDVYQFGLNIEMCHECSITGYNTQRVLFSHHITEQCHGILYSASCSKGCSSLMGCFGLRRNKYCILNKQYSKAEYEKLLPKIIEHMKKTGEWGEYFPMAISSFAYNETRAQEYFPLDAGEVSRRGLKWYEDIKAKSYKGPAYKIPDDINGVSDGIIKEILQCEATGKPYKIIPQELKFYREHGLPIPRQCPDERHRIRMNLRNPRRLYTRQCDKCQAGIQTTYAPDRPEKVYCETCYLETVY